MVFYILVYILVYMQTAQPLHKKRRSKSMETPINRGFLNSVQAERLELSHLAALDPKF